jgi:hypothetical protein
MAPVKFHAPLVGHRPKYMTFAPDENDVPADEKVTPVFRPSRNTRCDAAVPALDITIDRFVLL